MLFLFHLLVFFYVVVCVCLSQTKLANDLSHHKSIELEVHFVFHGHILPVNDLKLNTFAGEPASSVGWREPGFIHTSFLKELWPNKEYVILP